MGISLGMLTAEGTERPFALNKPRMIIGRDMRCDLRVALPNVEPQHCEIIVDGSSLKLRDLGSAAGTLHNGSRVVHADLSAGDRVTVGPVTFIVRIDVVRHEGDGSVEITTHVRQTNPAKLEHGSDAGDPSDL